MNLLIEIRRNSDGETASSVWENFHFNQFWWDQGNAACDCNRELFFWRANGEPDDREPECSKGRYAVMITDNDTGEILYNEFAK